MFKLTSLLLLERDNPNVLFIGNYQLGNSFSFAKQLIRSGDISGKIISKYNISAENLSNRFKQSIESNSYDSVCILVHPSDFGLVKSGKFQDISSAYDYIIDYCKQNNISITIVAVQSQSHSEQEINTMKNWLQSADSDNVIDLQNTFKSNINFLDDGYNLSKLSHNEIKSRVSNILTSNVNTKKDSKSGSDSNDTISRKNKPGNVRAFINMFKDIAIDHQEKFGIPASITLAQGALESGWGGSYLSRVGNNYFGIKCHSWSGDKIYADDDAKDECFRKYESAEESFKDHAIFLKQNSRYKSLFKTKDYLEWAYGLQSAGYATSPSYATSLINLIETYGLNDYDEQSIDSADNKQIKLTNLVGKNLAVYSPYGLRRRGMHYGIDYSPMPMGSKIYVTMAGEVAKAGNIDPDGWGNTIIIDHEDGTSTLYAHLSDIAVKKGDIVSAGTYIGATGGRKGYAGSGNSEGEHLHWEYHPGGFVGRTSAKDGESVSSKYFSIV